MFIKRLSILFTSAVAVLVLSACDNGDGAGRYPGGVEPTATPDPGVTPAPSPEPNSVSMSGVAAKGLILGGVVNVYPIVDGRVGSEALAASVVTEDDGSYSLTIADYDGGPVVVRVTADQDTQMICDLSSGCGNGSSFGDTIALSDSDFKLDAIIPGAEGGTFESVNVSVLTNTAATTALNELAEAQDVSQVNLANLIADANSRVANRFGLLGDLYSIPLIDVTNPANLVGVDSRIIEFAFINTAVVQAILQGNGDFSIAQAANQFVAQYAANGGLADREATDTTAVSLAEILAEVSRILEVVQTAIENDPSVAVDLSQLAVSIRNDRELAEMGSTEPSNGLPSDGNQSDLEKVK
ncbi:MAG: hypothetical protein KTR17_06885, partial [Cellvibrionaceae bacterium]|nr:hypothetical protein [Cellvibrionaceae bacterium]